MHEAGGMSIRMAHRELEVQSIRCEPAFVPNALEQALHARQPGRDVVWFIHDCLPEPIQVYVPPTAAGTKYDWQFSQSAGAI